MRKAYSNRMFVVQNHGAERAITALIVAKWGLVVIGFGLLAYLTK